MAQYARKEISIVLAACHAGTLDRNTARVVDLASLDLNWNSVFALSSLLEVEAVAGRHFAALSESRIPGAARSQAAVIAREARAKTLAQTDQAIGAIDLLKRAGIDSILLKGPTVGVLAYGDVSMRSFADTDLLIHKRDSLRAKDILVDAGYRPAYDLDDERFLLRGHHALEFVGPRAKVELHSALLSRHLSLDVNASELWASAIPMIVCGTEVLSLGKAQLFMFLCAHGAKHEWMRLRWICDIAELARRLDGRDVEEVQQIAARLHARRILALGLCLTEEVLGVKDLPTGLKNTRARSMVRQAAARISEVVIQSYAEPSPPSNWRSRLTPGSVSSILFWASMRERLRDRARVYAMSVVLSGTVLRFLRFLRRPQFRKSRRN